MTKLLRFLLLTLVVTLLLTSRHSATHAQQDQSPPGIDLIILLDQSGSMATTDPDDRRVYTTQYLIDYMAFDNKYVNPDRSNRVVVINIGSPEKTDIMVPLTFLKNEEAVTEAKNQVRARELGDTSFITALQLVRQVFPLATDEEITSGQRQRLIVIISDGGPYDNEHPPLTPHSVYFAELREYYNTTSQLAQNYPIYVVGIDDADKYWPRVGALWMDRLALSAERVIDVNAVNQYVAGQLCGFLNPTGDQSRCDLQEIGDHFIQPYASTAAFSFFKYSPNAVITLTRPDEDEPVKTDPRDADLLDFQTTPRDELYVVSNPRAGCWLSERQGEGKVDVITQVVFNDLRLTQPAAAHPQVLPLQLVFELRDPDGRPIDEDPAFPVTVAGLLTSPDGSTQTIQIQRASDQNGDLIPGRYLSTNVPELTTPGDYQLTVTGFTTVADIANNPCVNTTEPFKVFQNEYSIPVILPGFRVLAPETTWLQFVPLTDLRVGFVDENGSLLPMPDTTPWTLELALQAPSGESIRVSAPVLRGGNYQIPRPLILPESGEYILTALLKNTAGETFYTAQASLSAGFNLEVVQPPPDIPAATSFEQLAVQLLDLQGRPFTPDEQTPVRLEIGFFPPGASEPLETITLTSEEAGRFESDVSWKVESEGEYTFRIRGFIVLAPGDEPLAFEQSVSLNASGALPYFKIALPDPAQVEGERVFSLHKGLLPVQNPMTLRVEVWRNGQLAAPQDAFSSDANALATVSIQGPDGQILVNDRPLTISEDGLALETSAPELIEVGKYAATFTFQGGEVSGLPITGLWPDATITFERRDPAWVLWTWRGTIALLILAALAILIWYLLEFHILEKTKGTLVVEYASGQQMGQKLTDFPLTRQKRHTVTLNKRQLGLLRLKSLKVTPAGTRPSARRGRDGTERLSVRVEATNLEGRGVANGTLVSGGQTQLCTQPDMNGERYRFKLSE